MARGMTTAASTAAQAETVFRTVALELVFDTGPLRLNGSPDSIFIGGVEYVGVGALGSIGVAEEGADLASYSLTAQLSAIPRDSVALALLEPYQNRKATLWEVILDATTRQVVADPVVIFRGRMNTMAVDMGDTGSVTLTIKNRLGLWERARNRRYTDLDHKRDHPTDTFFDKVSATNEKTLRWPAASFFK